MLIKETYEAGLNINKAVIAKGGNIFEVAKRLENIDSRNTLASEYTKICAEYEVINDNTFLMELLNGKNIASRVSMNLRLGILSNDGKGE